MYIVRTGIVNNAVHNIKNKLFSLIHIHIYLDKIVLSIHKYIFHI